LHWLVNKGKIKVYGFVIMPNHIHLIWELLELNGKEMPNASFNKWTSNTFFKSLRNDNPSMLSHFEECSNERKHRFWLRDPLAILLDSKANIEQKLEYLHLNPLQEHWNLCKHPEDYHWSSASFYHSGKDEFDILTHYQERF